MKKYFIYLVAALLLNVSKAQLLFPFKATNNEFGFKNIDGEVVIEPKYKEAKKFSEGYCGVKGKNHLWAFIDSTGKEITDYIFNEVYNFSEGIAAVYMGRNRDDMRWGYINQTGEVVIKPKYGHVGNFKNNLAWVKGGDKNYYGYVDKYGTLVIAHKFSEAFDFVDDLAKVGMYVNEKRQYGFIDKSGSFVVEPDYERDNIRYFGNNLFIERDKNGNEKVINAKGKKVIKTEFESIGMLYNGYFQATDKDYNVGIYDMTGKVVVKPLYKSINDAGGFMGWFSAVKRAGVASEKIYLNLKGEERFFLPKSMYTGYNDYASYYTYGNEIPVSYGSNVKSKWYMADRVTGTTYEIAEDVEKVTERDGKFIIKLKNQGEKIAWINKEKNTVDFLKFKNRDVVLEPKFMMVKNERTLYRAHNFLGFYVIDSSWNVLNYFSYKEYSQQSKITILKTNFNNEKDKKTIVLNEKFEPLSINLTNEDMLQVVGPDVLMYKPKETDTIVFHNLLNDKQLGKYKLLCHKDDKFYSISLLPIMDQEGKLSFLDVKDMSLAIKGLDAELSSPFKAGDKYTRVKKGDLYGAIDKNGDLIIPYKHGYMTRFANEHAAVASKGKYGIINYTDKMVIPYRFDDVIDVYSTAITAVERPASKIENFYTIVNGVISGKQVTDLNKVGKYKQTCPKCNGFGKDYVNAGTKTCWKCDGKGTNGWTETEREAMLFHNTISVYGIVSEKKTKQKCGICGGKGFTGTPKMTDVDCDLCKGEGQVDEDTKRQYIKAFNESQK